MLTRQTQIPTHARGKVRALVKAHKHWPVFLRKQGLISASAKNSDLLTFALWYPDLAAQIEAIIRPPQTAAELEFARWERNTRTLKRLKRLLAIAEKQFA
jgi:hypothetical protein